MEDGGWRMVDGGWRMEVEDGGWRWVWSCWKPGEVLAQLLGEHMVPTGGKLTWLRGGGEGVVREEWKSKALIG